MKKRNTNFVIAEIGGMPVILAEYYKERNFLTNEKSRTDDHGFIKFANARNLSELLLALEEIYDEFDMLDFTEDYIAPGEKPGIVDPERAAEICGYFAEGKPTRTTLERTREALEEWSFVDAKPKYTTTTTITNGDKDVKTIESMEALNFFTPLEDIVKSAEDLRRTSLMFAWLVGKCDFQTVHGLDPSDRKAKIRTLRATEPKFLAKYYEDLRNNTGNAFASLATFNAVESIHLFDEATIESTVSGYVEGCFNVMMSDTRVTVNGTDLSMDTEYSTILSAAWTYFARGLNKEYGSGAIGVCRRCGRFYEQKRKTRQYCSDSCRVMTIRKGEEKPGTGYVSKVSQYRALRKEAEEKAKMNLP